MICLLYKPMDHLFLEHDVYMSLKRKCKRIVDVLFLKRNDSLLYTRKMHCARLPKLRGFLAQESVD